VNRILNPRTGRPFGDPSAEGILSELSPLDQPVEIPPHIADLLEKAKLRPGKLGPNASAVSWRDVLTPRRVVTADSAQVLNTTTETIMVPDFTFAADALEAGDVFKYTIFFDLSTVITTPGTVTFRLRWGGVGGTALAASGAIAPDPTAASTDIVGMVEWYFVARTLGATGSAYAFGRVEMGGDHDDASATALKGNLDMRMMPTVSAAAVTINTTTANALSPTVQFSVATATTQLTGLLAILESLN